MLPLLLAILVFGVAWAIVRPLLRAGPDAPDAASFDRAVYRDQLRELDRDIQRGVLTETDSVAARLEIQRRLLGTNKAAGQGGGRTGRSPKAAVIVALLIAMGAVGFYLRLGAPEVPDMPFAARPVPVPSVLVASRLRAEREPSNPQTWILYAQAAAETDQWREAASAFKHAIDLGQTDAGTLTQYAEMLTLEAGGTVPPAARTAFDAAWAKDPKVEAARYYVALATMQAGEPAKALAMLQALLVELGPESPARTDVTKRINEAAKAAGSPTAADPDQVAIRGMVDRLAARLEAAPDDVDGWLRLGRAYFVLGEKDKSAAAYDRAAGLKPNDAGIPQVEVQALLAGLPAMGPVPARALVLLRRIEALTPGQPAVLWYLGLVSAQTGGRDTALGYWGRLLDTLPPEGEEAKTLRSAMAALRGR